MAAIDITKPTDVDPPDPAEFREYRRSVRDRVGALPDAGDSGGDETTVYDGRHVSVSGGDGAVAGGDVDMQGDDLAGFSLSPVSVTASLTIDLTNWRAHAGRLIKCNSASPIIVTIDDTEVTGTAQGGTASTIVLAAGDAASDNDYDWCEIEITSGTGSGQRRLISLYASTGKTATISAPWTTTPDNTSVYAIRPHGNLAMTVIRKGTGSVSFAAAGGLTLEALSNAISTQYAWASVFADLDDNSLSVSA